MLFRSLMKAAKEGRLQEGFGTGTAAVISPIGELNYKGEIITLNDFKTGDLTQKFYDTLQCKKDYLLFDDESTAQQHTQMGGYLTGTEYIMNWLEDNL